MAWRTNGHLARDAVSTIWFFRSRSCPRAQAMTEKRVLLAALLSAIFLSWYSATVLKPASRASRRAPNDSTGTAAQPALAPQRSDWLVLPTEEIASLESSDLRLEFGKTTGTLRTVTLKRFPDPMTNAPLRFYGSQPIMQFTIGEQIAKVEFLWEHENQVAFALTDEHENLYRLVYALDQTNSLLGVTLSLDVEKHHDVESATVTVIGGWTKGDHSSGRSNILEAIFASRTGAGKLRYRKYASHAGTTRNVPRGTFLATLSERYFCHAIRLPDGEHDVSVLSAPNGMAAFKAKTTISQQADGTLRYSASVYFGPRDYFVMKLAKFEQAIPIGTIGQIGLILLLVLRWIASLAGNYGLAIVLFSLLITLITSPLTLVSMRSMRKMQELKPEVDRVMAQHKNDQTKANQAVFALYKEHRVSPLSGCLPMLLQMPIFIALFQAISHFVELRGASFLWIKDLSLPDRLAQLPIHLPVIGNELNLLPVIMAGAMFLQTKLTKAVANQTDANPSMKMLSGPLMPVLFCLMFYGFPAGLVLYWLTNTVASVTIYKLLK